VSLYPTTGVHFITLFDSEYLLSTHRIKSFKLYHNILFVFQTNSPELRERPHRRKIVP
jgi:hypothetical protein